MSELGLLLGGVTRLLIIVGGGVCTIMVGYAGIMWMMSGGDPQGMAKAKMALLGALGGLVVVGLGFILPWIVSSTVVQPAGGVAFDIDVGVDCDAVLRGQLVFQRGASDAGRMNMVVREVQVKRVECAPVVWNPFVDDNGYSVVVGRGTPSMAGACFSTPPELGGEAKVGDLLVPRGLRRQNDLSLEARPNSGRDSENNIIVYWGDGVRRPSDEAACWLYVDRLGIWSSGY